MAPPGCPDAPSAPVVRMRLLTGTVVIAAAGRGRRLRGSGRPPAAAGNPVGSAGTVLRLAIDRGVRFTEAARDDAFEGRRMGLHRRQRDGRGRVLRIGIDAGADGREGDPAVVL